jgi:anti-sigma factor RsiW
MTPFEKKTLCAWVSDRIDPFLDGDLPADERSEFESHLESCTGCRDELTLARTVLNELRGLPAQTCPDRAANIVVPVPLPDASPTRRWFAGWSFRPALAGALAVIVFTALFLVSRMDSGTEKTTDADIARARAEVEWTIALVGDVSRKAGRTVKEDVIEDRVVVPMRKAVHSAIIGDAPRSHSIETNGG